MALKNIAKVLFGAGLFYSASAQAQAIDSPGKLGKTQSEVAVLDDSANTWHNSLDVYDNGSKGDKVTFGLKSETLEVKTNKLKGWDKTYRRRNLVYCLIDRDPGATNPENPCYDFPIKGGIALLPKYTDGWFSLYLEVKTNKPNQFVRLDEYFRLPKPEGTMTFRKKGEKTEELPEAPAPKDKPKKKEEGKSEAPIVTKKKTDGKEEGVKGLDPFELSGETKPKSELSTDANNVVAPTKTAAPSTAAQLPAQGNLNQTANNSNGRFSFSVRGQAEPFNYQNSTLPNSKPRIENQRLNLDLGIGYSGENVSIGLIGGYSREGFSLADLGKRVAFGTGNELINSYLGLGLRLDNESNSRGEAHFRTGLAGLYRKLSYGLGASENIVERTKGDFGRSLLVDLDLNLPQLLVPNRVIGLGVGLDNRFYAESTLSSQEQVSRTIDYGRKNGFVNRAQFVFTAPEQGFGFNLGWQHDSVPTLRSDGRLSPNQQMVLLNPDVELDLSDSTRANFTGNQAIGSLYNLPNTLNGYMASIDFIHKFSGDVNRREIGFSFGRNVWNLRYDFSTDDLDLDRDGDFRRAVDNRHTFSLELTTDSGRNLMLRRRPSTAPTLR